MRDDDQDRPELMLAWLLLYALCWLIAIAGFIVQVL